MLSPHLALSSMLDSIGPRLDRVDRRPVGSAHVDLGAVLRGTGAGGVVGARADAEWRATESLSLFGQGEIGHGWGSTPGLYYSAIGGLRFRR